MLPTFVFLAALVNSLIFLISIIEYISDRIEFKYLTEYNKNTFNKSSDKLLYNIIIVSLAWSWLYWLSH